MKIFSSLRMFVLLTLGLMIAVTRLEAQDIIGLHIQGPTSIGVSNAITYILNLTNQMGFPLTITATNTMSGTKFQMGSATTSMGTYSVGSSNVVFNLGSMTNLQVATMTMVVTPTSVGSLTNLPSAATNGVFCGFASNFVVQVTNPASVADLAVAMTGPPSEVFTNDYMTYGITVTNSGPGTATNVFLTNTLPAMVILKSVSPTNQSSISSNLIFNLGTLTNGAFKSFHITVVPTNAGTLTFSAVVSTNSVLDSHPTNNLASMDINVATFIYDQLLFATNVSAMTFDPQTGLMNQTIRLVNNSTNAVAAARVIVSGLTNWLYNAVGTNSDNPYVVYNAPLTNNQTVDLVLEYFIPTKKPILVANSNYTAVGVSNVVLSVSGGTSGAFSITNITALANGNILIEFESMRGSNYTVLYGNDLLSVTQVAQPSIVAPANRTQWIDDGPPKTVIAPTNGVRYYRVLLNQ